MVEAAPLKVWFITGCSTGLGRALAERALSLGHKVIATARKFAAVADLEVRHPGACKAFALDVKNDYLVPRVVAEAAQVFGRLDVVVNNAGYGLVGAFEELGREQITRNFDTNFFGALNVIRETLPILRAQRAGHIVNISAAAAISNYPGFSIYGAAKWALEGASESLAAELKPLGIKVTIVQPGPFRTDFVGRSMEHGEVALSDYQATSGKFLRFLKSMNGKQPGDPTKAADAIIAAVNSPAPPLRLVLGKYANDKVRKKSADMERERAAWESTGQPTDYV